MTRTIAIILVLGSFAAKAQVEALDSLQKESLKEHSEEQQIDILNQRSFLYLKISVEKSEAEAVEALRRAVAIQYQKGIADGYVNLGICNSIRGVYDKGLDFFIKGSKIREEIGDVTGSAKALNNMAGIFMYQKDFRKALEYSGRSLKLVTGQNDKPAIGNALLAHGLIYESMGDSSKALGHLRLALKVFEDLKNKGKQGEVLISMSGLYEANANHRQALETCFRAMDLLDAKEDFSNAIELFLSIGQIYSGIGNDKTAAHYFHRAMNQADQHRSLVSQMASRLKLSSLFEKLHQYDSALFYYQSYAQLNEATYSKEKANQLAMLEKVYETEQKDQQLELDRQKIQSQNWIITGISIVLLLSTVSGVMLYRYYHQKRIANIQLSELNKVIHERNEEITAQSEELMEANEEIRRINESLEEEVSFRTLKIKTQNEKLIEYAYFNAHKVRGPLARILGLAMLIETDLTLEEIRDLNKKLNLSALELDEVIKEINKKLGTEEN